jgi:Ni2+-binding GTPase involved in maturation of urease and hydrogenase
MKMLTVSGPPSSGKTSLILKLIQELPGLKIAFVKFDCLTSSDQEQYEAAGVPVVVGYAGKLCPDHFFVTNHDSNSISFFKLNWEKGLFLMNHEAISVPEPNCSVVVALPEKE